MNVSAFNTFVFCQIDSSEKKVISYKIIESPFFGFKTRIQQYKNKLNLL
jgi:hypothetical protein